VQEAGKQAPQALPPQLSAPVPFAMVQLRVLLMQAPLSTW
jgi:hypothetical protein